MDISNVENATEKMEDEPLSMQVLLCYALDHGLGNLLSEDSSSGRDLPQEVDVASAQDQEKVPEESLLPYYQGWLIRYKQKKGLCEAIGSSNLV